MHSPFSTQTCGILKECGLPGGGVPLYMSLNDSRIFEIAAGATVLAGAAGVAAWLAFRKRPSPDELELARRQYLAQSGRIVDGTLLDVCEVPRGDGQNLTMLLYDYRMGGADYQCSQDITNMQEVLDTAYLGAGLPCSVRYQPGNPQNSIVVSEKWSGLRVKMPPVLSQYNDPEPIDTSHLNAG